MLSQTLNKCHRHEKGKHSMIGVGQPTPKSNSRIGLFMFASQKLLFARRDVYHIYQSVWSVGVVLDKGTPNPPCRMVSQPPKPVNICYSTVYISSLSNKMIFSERSSQEKKESDLFHSYFS